MKRPLKAERSIEATSNFDHEIEAGAEDELRSHPGTVVGEHTAWEFYGAIWFENGKFYEAIMRFQEHVATLEGDSLDDVRRKANDRYGWE